MSALAIASRYLLVGGTCAAVNSIVLICGDRAGLPLFLTIGASFVVVCLAGYGLHSAITFAVAGSWQGLARYILAMAGGLPVSAMLLWLMVEALRWPMEFAAPATTGMTILFNFALSRWAVVRPALINVRESS